MAQCNEEHGMVGEISVNKAVQDCMRVVTYWMYQQQQESSLNDKLKQLVLECYYKLPEIKKQYQKYQKMVQAE